MKWITRYLRGTTGMSLCHGSTKISLQGYPNCDMVGDLDGRKSTIGYIFNFGSATMSWVSWLQKIVILSAIKVVYASAIEACKEMVWVQSLLKELGKKQNDLKLHSDNQSAIHFAKNLAFH